MTYCDRVICVPLVTEIVRLTLPPFAVAVILVAYRGVPSTFAMAYSLADTDGVVFVKV